MQKKPLSVKKISEKRLMNIAVYYLSKYESSAENLRKILENRVKKDVLKGAEPEENSHQWIENILKNLKEKNYLNDERFTQNRVKKYLDAGKSEKFIRLKLLQAGVDIELQNDIIKNHYSENPDKELQAACRLVKKKKLGHFRLEKKSQNDYKKDLAVLARAGFSFSIAKKALETKENQSAEYEENENERQDENDGFDYF